MPTGYTAKLVEYGQSFEEFALQCARAFGACIMMRDDPLDVPIPEEFQPSSYYAESLAKHQSELLRLEAMTNEERRSFGAKEKETSIRHYKEYIVKRNKENGRLSTMRAKVEAWSPPSDDHVELKKFMLQQIEVSLDGSDYWLNALTKAENTGAYEYWAKAFDEARRGIDYDRQEMAKELERTAGRNRWLRQLRESLSKSAVRSKEP